MVSSISIRDNVKLTTAPSFDALTSLGGDFTLMGNTDLSACCDLLPVVELVTGLSTPSISGNRHRM